MPENTYIIISFSLYLLIMLAICVYFYFKTKNLSDYILAGRSLNPWVTSLSAQASDMSGWLLMGLPGYAFVAGIEAGWIALGLAIGTYINWKFIAKRLRITTEKFGDAITLPDYFEKRFNDKSRVLRMVSAIFILIFFMIYTSSGFVAGAKLFNQVFGISYQNALLIGVFIIIGYTFLGGFNAVSWTDFIQGLMMFLAVVAIPIIGIFKVDNIHQRVIEINPNFMNQFIDTDGNPLSAIAITSLLAWGLGYFGQPHILARFMAIKSADKIKKARIIAMVWVVISLAGALLVGIIGATWVTNVTRDTETIFMILINGFTHPAIAGLLLAAILAAVMSTADSQLLVTSSSLVEDFYKIVIRKNASDREQVWISRLAVLLVAISAYLIARNPNGSVLNLVSYAWAGFGAAFGPLVIFSLYWKSMTRWGALAGLISGGVTVIVLKNLSGGIFEMYEIIPGFIIACIAIVVVSKVSSALR
ncbi:MAG: sodium/proline symporter PutP [Marinilabiliales bacterium]|nr:MAG: sodium/proline symporter PutP [Marinilabiliales bacterium]